MARTDRAKLRAAIARIRHERDQAVKDLKHFQELRIKCMEPDYGGGFRIDLTCEFLPIFAGIMTQLFEDSGGINFVEWTVTSPKLGPLLLSMRRHEGKSKGQIIADLKKRIEELEHGEHL